MVVLNPDAESFSPPHQPTWLLYHPQLCYYICHHRQFLYSPAQPSHATFYRNLPAHFSDKACLKKRPPTTTNLLPRGTTTLMIKNIPNIFKRPDLLDILDQHCRQENQNLFPQPGVRVHRSKYNFLYLPMDFCRGANLGYAFVNFTSEEAAIRFYKAFEHYKWDVPRNRKIGKARVARIQGLRALKSHFRDINYPYPTSTYLPVILSPPSDGAVSYNLFAVGKLTLSNQLTHRSS